MNGLVGTGLCVLAHAPITLVLSAHTFNVQPVVYSVCACWLLELV